MPRHRIDLVGEEEEPLLLQWRGSAGDLAHALGWLGWSEPPAWSTRNINALAFPSRGAVDLAVVPALHNGRRPAVTAILTAGPKGAGRYVLRAWEQKISTDGCPPTPLLLMSVVREIINRPLGLIALPLTEEDTVCDVVRLLTALPPHSRSGQP